MTMRTASDRPTLEVPPWGALTTVSPDLWRVRDRGGRVVGHVRAVVDDGRWRFRAERFHLASRSFRGIGEFGAGRDALESLRG